MGAHHQQPMGMVFYGIAHFLGYDYFMAHFHAQMGDCAARFPAHFSIALYTTHAHFSLFTQRKRKNAHWYYVPGNLF
jgi:hypothetical protein